MDYYFYDRIGINVSFFELFRLQQYQRKPLNRLCTNITSESNLRKKKEDRKFLVTEPQETSPPLKDCENKPIENCEKSLRGYGNLLSLYPIVPEVKEQVEQLNKKTNKGRHPLCVFHPLDRMILNLRLSVKQFIFAWHKQTIPLTKILRIAFLRFHNPVSLQNTNICNQILRTTCQKILMSIYWETGLLSPKRLREYCLFKVKIEKTPTKDQKIISKEYDKESRQ